MNRRELFKGIIGAPLVEKIAEDAIQAARLARRAENESILSEIERNTRHGIFERVMTGEDCAEEFADAMIRKYA